jgi:pimeloyl-ACP methyl ester carboxylesterase
MRLRPAPLMMALLLAGCAAAPTSATLSAPRDGEELLAPFDPADPNAPMLAGRVCPPAGNGPWRVALINHGSAASPEARGAMRPASCDSDAVRWFTAHNFLVVSVLRRGFGSSTGEVVEDIGACVEPDYARSGEAGADDIQAGLRAAFALPWAVPNGALVVGQSTGGWAALAYAGRGDTRVRAVLAFAPGRGGHAHPPPDSVCRADLLRQAAREFGAHAATPALWIAARNDSYFPPDVTLALQQAYTEGGGTAELALVNPFFDEGHALFNAPGGADLWGPLVQGFLSRHP